MLCNQGLVVQSNKILVFRGLFEESVIKVQLFLEFYAVAMPEKCRATPHSLNIYIKNIFLGHLLIIREIP